MPDTKRNLTPDEERELLKQIVTPHEKPSSVIYSVDDIEEVEGDYFGDEEAQNVKKQIDG